MCPDRTNICLCVTSIIIMRLVCVLALARVCACQKERNYFVHFVVTSVTFVVYFFFATPPFILYFSDMVWHIVFVCLLLCRCIFVFLRFISPFIAFQVSFEFGELAKSFRIKVSAVFRMWHTLDKPILILHDTNAVQLHKHTHRTDGKTKNSIQNIKPG